MKLRGRTATFLCAHCGTSFVRKAFRKPAFCSHACHLASMRVDPQQKAKARAERQRERRQTEAGKKKVAEQNKRYAARKREWDKSPKGQASSWRQRYQRMTPEQKQARVRKTAERRRSNPDVYKKSRSKSISKLKDSYVRHLLVRLGGGVLKGEAALPTELIEAKRQQLTLHRLVRKLKDQG